MHNYYKPYLLVLLLIAACTNLAYSHVQKAKTAGIDSIILKSFKTGYLTYTKAKKKHIPDTAHKPVLAFKRSGFIPGWGQLYNHKGWKVPLIYTGLGMFGSSFIYNHRYYRQYLTVYRYYQQDPATVKPNLPHYAIYKELRNRSADAPAIANYVNGFQRNMQLSILGMAGFWGIQMLDAYIDAKFKHSYSMDRDLAFSISPAMIGTSPSFVSSGTSPIIPALKLSVSL